MHVTILGAGALGRVYGARLAASGTDVAFLVRSSRIAEEAPFVIDERNGGRRRDVLDRPARVAEIPAHTDVVIVTVRFDQIVADAGPDALAPRLAATRAPIVVLTPLL